MDRSTESEVLLAQLVGGLAAEAGLRALDRSGAEATIERAARLTGDAAKLSLLVEHMHDLVTEADHWAGMAGRDAITRADVERALQGQRQRASRLEERKPRDDPARSPDRDRGQRSRPGQRPLGRGSCRPCVRPAVPDHGPRRSWQRQDRRHRTRGRVGRPGPFQGRSHPFRASSRGAMRSMPRCRFRPASSSSSLMAASRATAPLLQSFAPCFPRLPDCRLRQDLAVTGSVNQHGHVQAIGGVNEKSRLSSTFAPRAG